MVEFPETAVACAEHRGPPQLEYETSRKLIEWRIEHRLLPAEHRTYGVHYTDPYTTAPADHRVDFCVSYDRRVSPNAQGVVAKIIPANRCAVARHLGSRAHNAAAVYLLREWLPRSGEALGDFPIFFHYVNVGPNVQEHEMITDVYLPLRISGPVLGHVSGHGAAA
ncbi:AraC family transcriptional regulator [Lysobacter sp. CA196]|uniref:AraC family transcriptional regulator n=1 Tax=Lysobacter sp. CA196 TaxID=3455606 RepID=UPI003F8CF505